MNCIQSFSKLITCTMISIVTTVVANNRFTSNYICKIVIINQLLNQIHIKFLLRVQYACTVCMYHTVLVLYKKSDLDDYVLL